MAVKDMDEVNRKARELYEKATAALDRQNYDYAIETLLSALEIEPAFLKARQVLRAAQIRKIGKGGVFKRGFQTMGTMPAVSRAHAALKKGNALEALRLAEEALRAAPTSVPALKALAEAGEAAEMPEIGVHAMETAVEAHAGNVELLRDLARAYVKTDELEKAVACHQKILAVRPHDREAAKALKDTQALRTMSRGKWDQASTYRDVLRDEDQAKDLERSGRAVRSRDDAQSLLARLTGQLEEQPGNVDLMRRIADIHRQDKNYEEAIAFYRKALETEGKADPTLERLITDTRVLLLGQQIEEARSAGAAEDRIAALEDERRRIRIEDASQRVERYPTDLDFRFDLASLLFEAGELDEALRQFQQAQKSPHHRLASLNAMGLCFLAKEMDDLAARQFESALQEGNIDADMRKELLYNLATAYERTGAAEQAVERYKEIYQEDIGFRDVAGKIEAAYRRQREEASGESSGS